MRLLQRAGLLLLSLSLLPAYAARNKWVDDKGHTHYGDRVPAQYLGKERQVLNDQGIIVRKHNRLKTEEEVTEAERKKAIESEVIKRDLIAARKRALKDRVLTDTFTTEKDILMARDRKIDSITSQINLTETIIKDDEKKLSAIKKQIENLEKAGRQAPKNTKKSLVNVSRKLETHYQYVETKNQERENILRNFDKDIKRFRELKAVKKKQ